MAQRRRRRIRPGDAERPDPPGGPAEVTGAPPPGRYDRPAAPRDLQAAPRDLQAAPRDRAPGQPDRAAAVAVPERPVARSAETPARRPRERSGEERETERGLRGLVGGGTTQVGVSAAMRARDAARPSPEDLAAAEENLPIVLRGWVPRDPPPAR